MVFLLALPLYIYVSWRLTTSVFQISPSYHRAIRYAIIAIEIWLCSYPLLIVIVNQTSRTWVNAFANGGGWQDWAFVYPFWFWAVFALQTAPYLLASDVLGGLLNAIAVSFASELRKYEPLVLSILVLLTVAIRMYVDTRRPRIRHQELTVADLSEALQGFQIAHISDIHADPRTINIALPAANNCRPQKTTMPIAPPATKPIIGTPTPALLQSLQMTTVSSSANAAPATMPPTNGVYPADLSNMMKTSSPQLSAKSTKKPISTYKSNPSSASPPTSS